MEVSSLPDHIIECTNSYLHLWVDTAVKLMYTEWLALPSIPQYQESAALIIRFLQDYDVIYWVMDSNRLAELSLEAQRKVIEQILPAITATRLRKVARIIYQDEGNQAMFEDTTKELKNKHQAEIEIKHFQTFNEAAHWITWIQA